MKAIIYCRVSTAEQVDNTSLANQERECRKWAEREGFDVARVFKDEGESANTKDRNVCAGVQRGVRDGT